jgi:glutamyl-tRNA synthetase
MSHSPPPLRGRFAPSPTGHLHIGNARTALLAWLHTRAAGGTFVMRVEDLDRNRSRPELIDEQLEDLRWLGLDWDEGPDVGGPHAPYLQSERSDLYEEALAELDRRGLVYECVCTRREIAEAASAPHADDEGPRYPGTCLEREAVTMAKMQERRPVALRFRTPPGEVWFDDLVHGRTSFDPAVEVGDFVVRRKDGVAAYQLAVTVDDAAMGITHVVRADDLLSSTARQILLYRALGHEPPRFLHVPLMHGTDDERMAKRKGAVTLREMREMGVRPERLVGWLGSTCGLAEPGETLSATDLVERFDIARLPREPTTVDPAEIPGADAGRRIAS